MPQNRKMLNVVLLVVLFKSVCGATDAPVTNYCDDDWVNANGFCYLVKDGVKATYSEATKDCKSQGANLLTIETTDELNFLAGELSVYSSAGWLTSMYRFRNSWSWQRDWPVDPSVLIWSQEPNNAKGNENCAAISEQMTFTDEACDQKYGFLCEVAQEGCPLGFLIGIDRCLYISDTSNSSQLMTKQQAQARCKSMGPNVQLANLEKQDNIDFLSSYLPENAQTTFPWWVSVSKQNGQWMWDNGSPATLKWAKEPDNIGGTEYCAILTNGKLADKACNFQANYVCKKSDGSVPTNPYVGKYGCGNWIRAGKKCYRIDPVYQDTRDGAQQKCQAAGADLLRIDSLDEQYWIDVMATNYRTPFWTQLRSTSGGSWVYNDGSQPSSDILVWNQEPNDYMGIEDCVGISMKLTWNDFSCRQAGGYICEASSTGGCPKNWVSNNAGTCYFFGPSAANASNTLTWREARTACGSMAEPLVGTLLALDDIDELNFVNSQLSTRTSLNLFHWTGLNDIDGEGVQTYADNPYNPVDQSLIPWDQSPSCASCDPACASINSGGYFEDFECTRVQHFACEKYAQGISGSGSTARTHVLIFIFATLSKIVFNIL